MAYTAQDVYLARREGIESWMDDAWEVQGAIRRATSEIARRISKGDLIYDERQLLIEGAVKALAGLLKQDERRINRAVRDELRRYGIN